ncbi:RadC family protein [Aliamphritea spongicola]|uniref:RadC family protein n=1 Tax=Aliamphritea spongicola TaxID=707589 RepID=UPI00196B2330|nr:DNA repair protein RadC [Aliamphritea spongicola]MBN3562626.1 DNA repair protein RadC [Aliamphritea spongicola]
MAITDWPAQERPREKLLHRGAVSLSDAELLAIFLRTGISGSSAVDMARELLREFGSLAGVAGAAQKDLCGVKGIGTAKYVQLQAALQISLRIQGEALVHSSVLDSPLEVKHYLGNQLRYYSQEVFAALLLDNRHRVICFKELFYGTINSASVHPREVVKLALKHNAAALIICHNHPSGVAEPSDADVDITRHLQQALSLVDVQLLDHMVIGDSEVISMAERGLFYPSVNLDK